MSAARFGGSIAACLFSACLVTAGMVTAGMATAGLTVTNALAAQSVPPRDTPVLTPPEHVRGAEQTFLTYPEWFLVHSPAEYAQFIKTRPPSEFPYLGHIGQFWQGYGAVSEATRDAYPTNFGYHLMVMVIGVSTTVEYSLKYAYETLIGRLTEAARRHGPTDEDRFAAGVAQDYVDFIRVRPWYEYDFGAKLAALWREVPMHGADPVRKWERRWMLSTEYGAKAAYGWLIGRLTRLSYDEPLPVTALVLDRLPQGLQAALPLIKVLDQHLSGPPAARPEVLVTVPRYEAFMTYAQALASEGANFEEVAGNRGAILVSVLVDSGWLPAPAAATPLFTQPILTRPGQSRAVLMLPVDHLADALRAWHAANIDVEHIYDF